ncbi:gliding motility-associated C-terminal domain-containing protein [Lishizhenia sp.]|uniref:T9SS type B sorting domain-containing protein n=1 Tax=Lishizhenia sp. TaxID=2497594 RepID=UPI00299E06EC|nr:gliding motility-associated C-terminal domain-containing protein [Lishizhenia sp.]MDX1446652.1 gliding motility-associated C-terminal domain-containing protein [Lishizhenia sp.]
MRLITTIVVITLVNFISFSQAQIPTPSCYDAVDVCDSIDIYSPFWCYYGDNYDDSNYFIGGYFQPYLYTTSFPSINPTTPNAFNGCSVNFDKIYWVNLAVKTSGFLNFMVQSKSWPFNGLVGAPPNNGVPGGTIWILFPKNQTPYNSTCNQITNNQIAPVSCNTLYFTNYQGAVLSQTGNTGMLETPSIYGDCYPARIEPSIYVNAGDEFLLMIRCTTGTDTNGIPFEQPKLYVGNAVPGNENSTTSATFTCEPWTVPQNICLGDSAWVELSNTYNGYDDTYTFTFLNNASDVVDSLYAPWFQVLPTDTTTYNVEVSQNGTVYDTLSFTINVASPPTPNAGPDLFLCEGDTAQLSAQLSDTSNYFLWQITDTNDYLSAPDTLDISYASQPDNDLLILFENNGVCPTGIDSVYIYTHPTPQLQVLQDTTICLNGSAQLEAVVNNTVVQNYAWPFPSDSSSTQNFITDSSTWINCYAADSIGCSSNTDSVFITVLDSLSLSTPLNIDYCEGETLNLNSIVSGGLPNYTYSWQYGGQEVSTNPTTDFSPTGQDELVLILQDVCETPADTNIFSFSPYPMPSLNMNVNDTLLCYPGEVNVSFTTSPLVQNWIWNLGDGSILNDINPLNYTYNQTGIFDVSLTYSTTDNCKDTLPNLTVEVVENPVANFSFNNDITEFSTQVLFTNTSRYATYYSWSFENAQPASSTLENPTANFEEGEIGLYQIELIAFNEIGCTDTLRKAINITPEFSLFAPNTFTPNGDQSNNTWSVAVNGIDTKDFHVQIFNRHGTLIFESFDYNFTWDGTYKGKLVPTGTYTWKIDVSTSQNAERLMRTGFVNVQY